MTDAGTSPEPRQAPRLGSYVLLHQLGSGGMSSVHRAVHEDTGNVVAVKVLPRELAKNVMLLQRFLREAKSAEALDHPNIVAIYDRGFDRGRHYLVLEYVEGGDLHDRVRKNGPLPIDEATRVIREAAEGLRYAAARGMIHRDIKPANLLLPPGGPTKIIDLGLALQVADEDERVTRDGTTVGTVDYMSPEQARDSRKTSERSDIYSLGCTFHYLLTGKPPYPGGNVAEKLSRHFTAPVPDPGILRPDVPEALARVIRRMMAKRPDDRYRDYDQLIQALDHPEVEPVVGDLPDVLIDDTEEEVGLRPTLGGPGRAARDSTVPELNTTGREDTPPSRSEGVRRPATPEAAEISLADLAALGDDEDQVGSGRHDEGVAFDAFSPVSRGGGLATEPELPLKTWIAAGVMVGLVLALFGFAASTLLSWTRPPETPDAVARGPEPPLDDETPPEPIPEIRPATAPQPPVKAEVARPSPPPEAPPIPAPSVAIIPEPVPIERDYPSEWVDRLVPKLAVAPYPEQRVTVVRRLLESGGEVQVPSLALAFGQMGEVVELADTGPFFEDDCQIVGKARLIRARAGVRPIIRIEFSDVASVKQREATFVLGEPGKIERLCLTGLDLVVDARDLPPHHEALFLCRGAEVVLRDCTLTILNADDRRLSVFRLEDGLRPNRIILERTLVRGPARTLVTLAGSRAEVSLDRSAIFAATSPVFAVGASDTAGRSLWLSRSVIASRGPLVELSGKAPPLKIRALGTSVGRLAGGGTAAVIQSRSRPSANPAEILDWSGEDNAFVGWSAWLATIPEGVVRLADLGEARRAWPGSDQSSREGLEPWPAALSGDDSRATQLDALLPDRRGSLARVASPHPRLRDVAVGLVPRQAIPAAAESPALAPSPLPILEAEFDVQAAPWQGDLGAFLAQFVADANQRYIVRVRGAGSFRMTPVRLPDGASVAVLAEAAGPEAAPPTWVPSGMASGRAMIELRGGDLSLGNLSFVSEFSRRPRHWVSVEDGWLALQGCRLRDAGGPDPAVGPLVSFRARTAELMPMRAGPFVQAGDRPICSIRDCLLWTGADAIEAELGRGTIDLENCLLIAGGTAITLRPVPVDPARFDADLVMDRCTVAYERSGVLVEPWAGDPKGPDRPWLISTHACVYPRVQREGVGALLKVDPASFARGVVFWQSLADLYETHRFLRTIDPGRAAPSSFADVKKQWVEVWGMQHIRSAVGPHHRRSEHLLQFKGREAPRPGKLTPESLELDPSYHHEIGARFEALPLGPRG